MAQVVRGADVRAQIDHFLDHGVREWSAVPEYVEQFPTWTTSEQLDFVHEWAIRESALQVLRDLTETMDSRQRVRYDELPRMVAKYRPLVASLLRD